MSLDPSGAPKRPGDAPRPAADLHVSKRSKPVEVPVFNCIVHVSQDEAGGVQARVANLPGIASTAASEREALRQVVTAFKHCVSEFLHSGTEVPWIAPPTPAKAGEQTRYIPVHL